MTSLRHQLNIPGIILAGFLLIGACPAAPSDTAQDAAIEQARQAEDIIAKLGSSDMKQSDQAFLACFREENMKQSLHAFMISFREENSTLTRALREATHSDNPELVRRAQTALALQTLSLPGSTDDTTIFRLKALYELGDAEFTAIGLNQWARELLTENRGNNDEITALCSAMENWDNINPKLESALIYQRLIRAYSQGADDPIGELRRWAQRLCYSLRGFSDQKILLYNDILRDNIEDISFYHGPWKSNTCRIWIDPHQYEPIILANFPTQYELRQLHYLTHNFNTLKTDIAEEGIHRFKRKGHSLPSCCMESMNKLAARHHLIPVDMPATVAQIKNAAATIPKHMQGFIPRCLLALGGQTPAWEKMDVYDDLSIMHFPDTSAVRLPQWNCSYLITPDETTEAYRRTYRHNLSELDDLCKQAKAKNKTDLLIALALKECDDALPDNQETRHSAIATKQTACYSLLLEMNLGDLAVPIPSEDGPESFNIIVSSNDANRDEFERLREFVPRQLHSCITGLAVLEDRGEWDALRTECAALAELLNRYDVWSLLICQHELRGLSPLALSELFSHYERDPRRIVRYFDILRAPHYSIFPQFNRSWGLGGGIRAANILTGKIPASDSDRKDILDRIVTNGMQGYRDGTISLDSLHIMTRYLGEQGYGEAAGALASLIPEFGKTGFPSAVYAVIHHLIEQNSMIQAAPYIRNIHASKRYDQPLLHLAMSEYEEALGHDDLALKHYMNAVTLNALFFQAGLRDDYDLFVQTLLIYGNYRDAERFYFNMGHRVVDMYNLAEAYVASEQWDKANYIYEYIVHRGICVNAPSYTDPTHEQIVLSRAMADWTRGMVRLEQGKQTEAYHHIGQALSDISGHPRLTRDILTRLLTNAAIPAERRAQWKNNEIRALEQKLQNQPKHPGARMALDTLRAIRLP